MPITKGYKALLKEAAEVVTTYPVAEVLTRLSNGDEKLQLVDLRDVRELEREGIIDGAFHAPRGMLEFWVDPESPYYKPVFGEDKEFVFFCGAGWRSALAVKALQEMGMANVADIEGGFAAWKAAGAPVGQKEKK